MTAIDLTLTNEACARELFAAEAVERFEASAAARKFDPEVKARMMRDIRKMSRETWDSGTLHAETMWKYRERALAVLLVSHQDIARQAWDHCVDSLEEGMTEDDLYDANPYTTEES